MTVATGVRAKTAKGVWSLDEEADRAQQSGESFEPVFPEPFVIPPEFTMGTNGVPDVQLICAMEFALLYFQNTGKHWIRPADISNFAYAPGTPQQSDRARRIVAARFIYLFDKLLELRPNAIIKVKFQNRAYYPLSFLAFQVTRWHFLCNPSLKLKELLSKLYLKGDFGNGALELKNEYPSILLAWSKLRGAEPGQVLSALEGGKPHNLARAIQKLSQESFGDLLWWLNIPRAPEALISRQNPKESNQAQLSPNIAPSFENKLRQIENSIFRIDDVCYQSETDIGSDRSHSKALADNTTLEQNEIHHGANAIQNGQAIPFEFSSTSKSESVNYRDQLKGSKTIQPPNTLSLSESYIEQKLTEQSVLENKSNHVVDLDATASAQKIKVLSVSQMDSPELQIGQTTDTPLKEIDCTSFSPNSGAIEDPNGIAETVLNKVLEDRETYSDLKVYRNNWNKQQNRDSAEPSNTQKDKPVTTRRKASKPIYRIMAFAMLFSAMFTAFIVSSKLSSDDYDILDKKEVPDYAKNAIPKNEPKALIKAAFQNIKGLDLETAEKYLRQAFGHPDLTPVLKGQVYFYLGKCYTISGDFQKGSDFASLAYEEFSALGKMSSKMMAKSEEARSEIYLGNTQKALTILKTSMDITVTNDSARLLWYAVSKRAYLATGDLEKVLTLSLERLKIDPDGSKSLSWAAFSYAINGNDTLATYYDAKAKALRLEEKNVSDDHYGLITSIIQLKNLDGDPSSTINDIESFLTEYPDTELRYLLNFAKSYSPKARF